MRIFAVVLSLAMVFGTTAILPTVSAETAEVAADDIIFDVNFDGYTADGRIYTVLSDRGAAIAE